jgi:DNA-binding transcriptional ArsR family regulator
MDARLAVTSLAALAQESRLAVYRLLVEAGPTGLSVGEIGASVRVAPATLSFHLKELAHAGLIAARQEGRFIYYSANFAAMNQLLAYLTENCCARDGVACATSCAPNDCQPASRVRRKSAAGSAPQRRARRDTSKT